MKVRGVKKTVLVPLVLWVVGVRAEISDPVPVVIDTDAVLQWRTLSSDRTTVWFDWPEGASVADWQVCGMSSRLVASGKVSRAGSARSGSFDLVVAAPLNAESESTYSISVSFDAGSATLLTATFARVRGTGGLGARYVDPDAREWKRVRSSAVLPIAAGNSVVTIDGVPVDTGQGGAVGWYGWCPIGAGTHELFLSGFGPVDLVRTGGFIMYLR